MTGQVQFYVNGVHSVGGVTTWSFQAASFLANRYRTRIVTVNHGAQAQDNLFPGQVMKVWRQSSSSSHFSGSAANAPQPPRPTLPTKPTKPTKKVRKPTKPTKPTKPVKLPVEPPELSGATELLRSPCALSHLHSSAEEAIEQAELFIPNYLEFAYELAARSRAHGIASRCIGICHCDQENYYRLLTHYAPIIQSFVAVSPRCLKNLIACLPERESDMHLLPYGVAPPSLNPAVRRDGPIRVLYAGRLARKQKRIFDLVEIVRELDDRGVDYLLDIVGVGPDRDPLVEAFSSFTRVRIQSGVSHTEMPHVYKDHDVFLLPSETEGTSIALLESMAAGLVPVVTRVSGSEDVIIDGTNGFLCEVGDVCSMAKSIAFLAGNPATHEKMARKAQHTVAENYRIETQLGAFEQCVGQTLEKPLVPREVAWSVLQKTG